MANIELTQEEAQKLGFKSSIEVGQDLGFTDFKKTSVYVVKDAFLDLENLGKLKEANPRVVVRKIEQAGESQLSADYKVWSSWRQLTEQEPHYFANYKVKTKLVGQLSDMNFLYDQYMYTDNNFFKPFVGTKSVTRLKDYNDYPYARLRFPDNSANTTNIRIMTNSGDQDLRPKHHSFLSKEEKRKTYYRWHQNATRFPSGQNQSPYDNANLTGFSIPYPNTLSVYNSPAFNVATKIAPKFNFGGSGQVLHGLLVIATGDAEQKTICYVSPHTLQTGYVNTIEDLYTETEKLEKATNPGSHLLGTVINSSWYGSGTTGYLGCGEFGYFDNLNGTYKEAAIPSANKTHKRFYKVGDHRKQIYFDTTIPSPYGSGRWCMALSGNINININTGHNAVVYVHQPNSITDWKKKDPRLLSGPWALASGIHPKAASSVNLIRANTEKPTVSKWRACRTNRTVNTVRLQTPSLIIDSKFINDGQVLPPGVDLKPHTWLSSSRYPSWSVTETITGVAPNTGILYFPEGNAYSGYIVSGKPLSMQQIISSGINIGPYIPRSGYKNTISSSGHLMQTVPLKDTYFYKFYNNLYQDNNKTIATGTWNGIIPPGVRFSVELISTTLNTFAGVRGGQNLAVLYSGYGNGDAIDKKLQKAVSRDYANILFPNPSAKYIVSGEVPWHQKRNPYKHTFNDAEELVYSAYQSGPTLTDAKNIAKITAMEKINNKILQLVNLVLPSLTYKNKKWKSLQRFKAKLASIKDKQFTTLSIPESSSAGSQGPKRLSPYKQS